MRLDPSIVHRFTQCAGPLDCSSSPAACSPHPCGDNLEGTGLACSHVLSSRVCRPASTLEPGGEVRAIGASAAGLHMLHEFTHKDDCPFSPAAVAEQGAGPCPMDSRWMSVTSSLEFKQPWHWSLVRALRQKHSL